MLALACFTARSTEFLMPRPRAERSPDRGAMTPILAIFAVVPPVPVLEPREPQADKARAAAATAPKRRASRREVWRDPSGSRGECTVWILLGVFC